MNIIKAEMYSEVSLYGKTSLVVVCIGRKGFLSHVTVFPPRFSSCADENANFFPFLSNYIYYEFIPPRHIQHINFSFFLIYTDFSHSDESFFVTKTSIEKLLPLLFIWDHSSSLLVRFLWALSSQSSYKTTDLSFNDKCNSPTGIKSKTKTLFVKNQKRAN